MKTLSSAKKFCMLALVVLLAFCTFAVCACGENNEPLDTAGQLESIAVTKQPNKTEYEVGDKFSRSGMRVTAYFVGGTSKTILGYKIDKDGPLTLDDTVITVTYQDKSTTVTISVKEKVIPTQLQITTADFYTYKVEAEDCELGSETAGVAKEEYFEYHNDGKNNPNTSGGVSLGKLNHSKNTITLKIKSDVETDMDLIASLAYNPTMDFDAENETYWNGETVKTGWTVAVRPGAEYAWFDWQEYTLKGLKLKIGINELVFKIIGLSCNYDYFKVIVSPIDSEPVSIAVTTPPNKTEYLEGERFDPTGMVVTATFENGQTAPINDYTYYSEPLAMGNSEVDIFFGELSAGQQITVKERDMTLTSIEIDLAPYTKYHVGDIFHTEGMAVIAEYVDGFREYVIGWTVDKTDPLTESDNTVTVTYEGKTATLDITVEPVQAHVNIENGSPRTYRAEAENAVIVYNAESDTHGVENDERASGGKCIGNMRGTKAAVKYYIDSDVDTVADIVFGMAQPWLGFNQQAALYINGERDDSLTLPWMITSDPAGQWFDFKRFTAHGVALHRGRNVIEILMLGGDRGDGGIQFDYIDVVVNPLRSISATHMPNKTEYVLGESFDATGMEITAEYADGTTETVTDYTVSPSGALALTNTFVTVSYGDVSVDVEITVTVAAELTHIEVTAQPTKTSYRNGEYFDGTGMVVTAFYDDGSSSEIIDYTVDEFVSGNTVTVSYNGKTANVAVTANSPEKTHISVDKNHAEYVLEFEDADYSGAGYTLADATGSNPNASGGKWLDGFDGKPEAKFAVVINSEVEGTAAVFLSIASGKTAALDEMWDFAWNGRDFESGVQLPSLGWHPNGANSYVTSAALGALKLHKGYNYFEISTKWGSNVNMDCVEFAVTSDETVLLSSVAVTTPPSKTEYIQGESFDPQGMVVTATYEDGSTKVITDYAYAPRGELTTEHDSITVSYDGFTATTPVTVTAPAALSEIVVVTQPTKTAYRAGEPFDPTGMTVKAVFDDGSEITISAYTYKEYVEAGDTFVALSYEGKTVNVPVTVTEPDSRHITVTAEGMAENNGVYVLEFEDADYVLSGKTELVFGDRAESSGGKFLDGMDGRAGTTFEIRIYSEVESTAWILLSIAAPNGSLDSQWTFEWNGKVVLTGIPATTHGWFPGTNTEVSSTALGALPLHRGWNYIKITLKNGSNVNMDYIKIAVAPAAENTPEAGGDAQALPEAVLTENKGDNA